MLGACIEILRGIMAIETPAPEGAPAQPQQPDGPSLGILAQYVKDLSFENPGVRGAQVQPNIDLGIDVGATPHEDGNNVFEVSLRIQAKAMVEDKVLFLLELDYAGMFHLQGIPQGDMEAALLIECPRLIFPFARRIIADLTSDGGFPPLLVDPVDFRKLYMAQKQSQPQADPTNAGPMSVVAGAPQGDQKPQA